MTSMQGNTGYKPMKEKIPQGYTKGTIQQYTPEAMDLYKQLFSNVGPDSYLSRLAGGDENIFNEIEAPALRQFSGLQGNMASRFSGQGMGATKSSGFKNTMNQAASDFAQDLQSQRNSLKTNAIKELMGLSSDLLEKKPFQQTLTEKPMPWWQELLMSFGKEFSKGLASSVTSGGGGGSSGGNQNMMNSAAQAAQFLA